MQFVNQERAPEGAGLGQVDDQHALDATHLGVAAGRVFIVVGTGIGDSRHDIEGCIPKRHGDGQEENRDVRLGSLAGQDHVGDGHED